MNFGTECRRYLTRRSGEINRHAAGIHGVHREAARSQPSGNRLDIPRRRSVYFAELSRRQPSVEIGRGGIVLLVDKILQRLFALRTALQLQKHVIHRKRHPPPSRGRSARSLQGVCSRLACVAWRNRQACVTRTRAGGAFPALCASRADVKPIMSAQQHNRRIKKDLARKFFDIGDPRKVDCLE